MSEWNPLPFYLSFSPTQAEQAQRNGWPDVSDRGLVLIWAQREMDARLIANAHFGPTWCALYTLEDLDGDMAVHFPLGVTFTIGLPVEVVFWEGPDRGRTRVARFDDHDVAVWFVDKRTELKGALMVAMNGASSARIRQAMSPFVPAP